MKQHTHSHPVLAMSIAKKSSALLPIVIALSMAFAATAPTARAETAQAITISAGTLDQALVQLAQQSGLQLLYSQDLVSGIQVAPIHDNVSAQQALTRLLSGTGISFSQQGNTLYLSKQAQPETATLGTVKVVGSSTNATTDNTGAYTATGPSAAVNGIPLTLRETPQSVSVITSQRLKDQKITDLLSMAQQTTGLYVSQQANGAGGSDIYSRGFSIDTFMVNGVKRQSNYNSMFKTQDLSIFDRVEVVRGSSGLMNGVGKPGGAINMILKRPHAEQQGEVALELGSWNYKRAVADISTPLNSDGTVRARVMGVEQNSKTYIERMHEKRRVFYAVVEADLSDQTVARLGVAHQRLHFSDQANGALPAFDSDGNRIKWKRSASAAADWAYTKRSSTLIFSELEHEFANQWSMKLDASRTKTHSDELVGYAGNGYPNKHTGEGVSIWATHWDYEPLQHDANISVNGHFDLLGRQHDLAFGGGWSKTKNEDPAYTNWWHTGWNGNIPNIFDWDGSAPHQPYNPPVGKHGINETSKGGFASLRFRVTDDFSAIVGTRYLDWTNKTLSENFASKSRTITKRSEKVWVPYLGLTYDFLPNWTAYANYSDIFEPQDRKKLNGDYIDPLQGKSYEAGIKGELFDGALNLATAVYQLREDNKAIRIPGAFAPDGSGAYEAKSGTKTKGFEVEASGNITDNWQLSASFTHNRTTDSDGNRINISIPSNMTKLFTTYTIAGVGNGLTVGGGLRWQGKVRADNQGPHKVQLTHASFAVVDAMARYDINQSLSASLNLYNVFDKYYYTAAGSSYYGRPRSVIFTLSAKF